jgi:hypothetical protein
VVQRVSLTSALQQEMSCFETGDVLIVTLDLPGLTLNWSRSYAYVGQDWYPGGYQSVAHAFNYQMPVGAYQTTAGTWWYRDPSQSWALTTPAYHNGPLYANAEQLQYYFNTDCIRLAGDSTGARSAARAH